MLFFFQSSKTIKTDVDWSIATNTCQLFKLTSARIMRAFACRRERAKGLMTIQPWHAGKAGTWQGQAELTNLNKHERKTGRLLHLVRFSCEGQQTKHTSFDLMNIYELYTKWSLIVSSWQGRIKPNIILWGMSADEPQVNWSYDAKAVAVSDTVYIPEISQHFPNLSRPCRSTRGYLILSKLRVHQHCTGVPHFFLSFHPDDDALPLRLPRLVQQLSSKVPGLPPVGFRDF